MTKEGYRQTLVGGTTVLDMRHQTVDPLPIMPLESSWIGTFPRCSVPEPLPAAQMWEKNMQDVLARPDHILLAQRAPPGQSGMVKKARAQTPAGEKQEQHIQAQLRRWVCHGFDGWRWESERAQDVWVGTNIPIDHIQIFRSYILPQFDPCTNFEKSSRVSCSPAIQTVLGP
ncbi:hypothetical protein BGW80DRAFT_1335289 [Lactifluus volemus]|nr:hypothetical protein BGW80DRAFT_1335289 [Lactifluus volemus]